MAQGRQQTAVALPQASSSHGLPSAPASSAHPASRVLPSTSAILQLPTASSGVTATAAPVLCDLPRQAAEPHTSYNLELVARNQAPDKDGLSNL